MKVKRTERGFKLFEFADRYGVECSLQNSSLATEDAIWLGVDRPDPKILTPDGWVSVPLPEGTLYKTRMHLTREMVAKLLPILQRFVKEGEI